MDDIAYLLTCVDDAMAALDCLAQHEQTRFTKVAHERMECAYDRLRKMYPQRDVSSPQSDYVKAKR